MIAMFPLILVQFLNESMFVALIDMVLVSSPVPSPLHTIDNLEKTNISTKTVLQLLTLFILVLF